MWRETLLASSFCADEFVNRCLTMKSFRSILFLAVCVLLASRAFCDLVDEGNTKAAKGDLDGAITDYTKAIDLNRSNTVAYCDRGTSQLPE